MWLKSPKSSTFNTHIHPTGVAVLATAQTTVTYTTIGADGLESYQQSPDVVQSQNEDHIGFSRNIPAQSADTGFGFFSSAPNLLQSSNSSNAPIVEIKVLRRPTLLQKFFLLKDIFHWRYSNKALATTLSPEEAEELASRFVHQRSGDVDVISLDPSLLSRSSGIFTEDQATKGLTSPINSSAIGDDDEGIVYPHITLSEDHGNPRQTIPEDEESFLPWQEEMMRSDARKREESLLERAMEVQAIEARVREEEYQARQWLKSMNAPNENKPKLRVGRLVKKGMKKLFGSK